MLIKLISSRPKLNDDGTAKLTKNGKRIIVFKYSVHGTKEDLAKYKEIQGEHYREDDEGTPLYFNTRAYGRTATLSISVNDKLYVDTTNLDLAVSLIESYGRLGELMAMAELTGQVPTNSRQQIEQTDHDKIDE